MAGPGRDDGTLEEAGPGGWLLRRYPEWARAVRDALRAGTGDGVDPVRLAEWLGRGGSTGR
ncbi:hypothetical protein ACWGH2_21845 [Streptomyces sp. NPDC054871]